MVYGITVNMCHFGLERKILCDDLSLYHFLKQKRGRMDFAEEDFEEEDEEEETGLDVESDGECVIREKVKYVDFYMHLSAL